MKKFFQVVFNIFWILTGGLVSAISSALIGAASCLTIIGIPFGLQHFKFIPLAFAPAGKKVATKFTRRPIMNILFNIFGGFPLGIIYYVLGILCCITIILIPVGLQMFKIASFNFAPFGAEVVKEDEYSKYKDTNHDMDLLSRYIIANPNKIIDDTFSNNQAYVSEYIKKYDKESKKLCRTINTVLNIFVMIIAFLFLILLTIDSDFNIFFYGMVGTIVLLVIINNVINHLVYNLNMKKYVKILFNYYPENEPKHNRSCSLRNLHRHI